MGVAPEIAAILSLGFLRSRANEIAISRWIDIPRISRRRNRARRCKTVTIIAIISAARERQRRARILPRVNRCGAREERDIREIERQRSMMFKQAISFVSKRENILALFSSKARNQARESFARYPLGETRLNESRSLGRSENFQSRETVSDLRGLTQVAS